MRVFVFFTQVGATLRALSKAASLARGLSARIEVLVPHEVPYPLAVDEPAVDPSFLAKRCLTTFERAKIDTTVRLILCRERRDALRAALPAGSILVIGTRRRWWWPNRDYRLGLWLRAQGQRVVFVLEA